MKFFLKGVFKPRISHIRRGNRAITLSAFLLNAVHKPSNYSGKQLQGDKVIDVISLVCNCLLYSVSCMTGTSAMLAQRKFCRPNMEWGNEGEEMRPQRSVIKNE